MSYKVQATPGARLAVRLTLNSPRQKVIELQLGAKRILSGRLVVRLLWVQHPHATVHSWIQYAQRQPTGKETLRGGSWTSFFLLCFVRLELFQVDILCRENHPKQTLFPQSYPIGWYPSLKDDDCWGTRIRDQDLKTWSKFSYKKNVRNSYSVIWRSNRRYDSSKINTLETAGREKSRQKPVEVQLYSTNDSVVL